VSRPVVSDFTEQLYARLPPFQRAADSAYDYPLLRYTALLGDQAEDLRSLVVDAPSRLYDPATADVTALPALAALAGVDARIYSDRSNDWEQLRVAIAGADDNRAAGSTRAVLAAIRPALSQTRTAVIVLRDPARFAYRVRVYAREVPNQAELVRLLEATRPSPLIWELEIVPGQTWADLAARQLTYAQLGAYTHAQIASAVPGQPIT
jgi:P2-related tail formation protein